MDYGKYLQEFFLEQYKIVAIIESKVERWFEEADINTCLVILQKCSQKKERDENLARFVYLKKPLTHFIPPADDNWETEINRRNQVEKLRELILGQNQFYENEEIRIYPKSQRELWDEGYDKESKKYVGSKWGKYIRAPQIFFKILEKGKGKLVPLKEIADVRRGFTTGANEFFYLTEEKIKQWGIEKEFWMHKEGEKWVPNCVLRSFRETSSIAIQRDKLVSRILLVNKDKKNLKGTNASGYIRQGETREFGGKIPSQTETCRSRGTKWYNLGKNELTHIFYPRRIGDRFLIPYSPEPIYGSDNLFPVTANNRKFVEPLAAFLNSVVAALFNEISGRKLTGAINVIDMDVWMAQKILVPNFNILPQTTMTQLIKKFSVFNLRAIEHSLKEFGASSPEEVSLAKVKPDRRELDKVVMGDILGLTEEEQLEVYRAVVDLVSSRIKKAKSVDRKKKINSGIDIDAFVKTVMEEVGEKTLAKFYQEKILTHKQLYTKKLPKPTSEIGLEAELGLKFEEEIHKYRLYSGKKHIFCKSEPEARYLKVWVETGLESVKVPKDEDRLAKVVPPLEKLMEKIKKIIESYTDSILQPKLRQRILHQLWQKLTEGIE